MRRNETFKINLTNEVKHATIEIVIGQSEKHKYGRKFIYGSFDYYVNYNADRWECLPEWETYNLKFTDEDDNEIKLRPVNIARIENQIELYFNELDYEQMINWGADEDKIRFYDDTPAYPITL
jgi:hypothetical protein